MYSRFKILKDGIEIADDVIVRIPNDEDAVCAQFFRTNAVVFLRCVMDISVNFNDKLQLCAIKIRDEFQQRFLTDELQAIEPSAAYGFPEYGFRTRSPSAKIPCAISERDRVRHVWLIRQALA